METFELILFLLTAVIASSILDKFLPPLSLPLVQIALGAALALAVPTPLEWGIDPELLLILFIAPLHFNESRHVGLRSPVEKPLGHRVAFRGARLRHRCCLRGDVARAFARRAPGGCLRARRRHGIYRCRGRHGADPRPPVRPPSRGAAQGRGPVQRVTGTVVFQCCLTILATGSFSLLHAGEEFALDLFGGFFGGLIMGLLAWGLLQVLRRTGLDNPTLHVMLELLLPFVIYLAAKSLHIGAVIAVVASGLMLSLLPSATRLPRPAQAAGPKRVDDLGVRAERDHLRRAGHAAAAPSGTGGRGELGRSGRRCWASWWC